MIRQGIRSLLELAGDIVVVAEAADGDDAITMIRRERPDVMLLDLRMPRTGGVEVLRELQDASMLPPTIVPSLDNADTFSATATLMSWFTATPSAFATFLASSISEG